MRIPILVLALAACGGGAGGHAAITFDDGATSVMLDGSCALTDREELLDITAIDQGDHVAFEAFWDRAAITAPGTYEDSAAGGISFAAVYPPPDDPGGALFAVHGTLTFTTYDPDGEGVVAGSLAWTVVGLDPPVTLAGDFACVR